MWHSAGQKSLQYLAHKYFGRNNDFINSFWNLLTFMVYLIFRLLGMYYYKTIWLIVSPIHISTPLCRDFFFLRSIFQNQKGRYRIKTENYTQIFNYSGTILVCQIQPKDLRFLTFMPWLGVWSLCSKPSEGKLNPLEGVS